ncbi:hypothetical protein KQI65_14545 [bacterium]|nr:hypothetical protein [bacterium]
MRYAVCFMLGMIFLNGSMHAQQPSVPLTGQQQDESHPGSVQSFSAAYEQAFASSAPQQTQALLPEDVGTAERKSAFIGVLYSLVLPGMGELYAGRFDKGKYPLIIETGLWLGLVGVNSYGNWVEDDARLYAIQHAGIQTAGKDDNFFVDIENYQDLYAYNNQMLIERRLDEVYPDEQEWRWNWDSKDNRLDYKDQRIFADELHNGVTYFVLGMIANRIWSAIQAATAVNSYNASLTERLSQLPGMHARMTSYAGRIDGMQLVFTW